MSDAARTAAAIERAEFNDAFLGYKIEHGTLFIRVCAWCPGAPQVRRFAAKAPGVPVTDGMCTKHFQSEMEKYAK